MGDLSLSADLYSEKYIEKAIEDFSSICEVSYEKVKENFEFDFIMLDKSSDKQEVLDEFTNYILGLMM